MNSVERVKRLCKERKIPISKLEKDLGYSNGYIGQLRKGVFPADRLADIAKYLSVSVDYLLTGDTGSKTVASDDEIKFALFGGDGEITDEMFDEVKRYAQFIKERKRNGGA